MKFATFNLYQFVAPGYYWYEQEKNNTYTPNEWQQKQNWIKQRLKEMDADVIGFQEVFSVSELETLCQESGYAHFLTLDTPKQHPDNNTIYTHSVVALASRYPIKDTQDIHPPPNFQLPNAKTFQFSRQPICATLDIPLFGEITVYVTHLKSKRPLYTTTNYPDTSPWSQRILDTLQSLSQGMVMASLQRGTEASLLYHHISQQLAADNNAAIIVMGDMNDQQDSVPLAALKMQERIYDIGGIESAEWPEDLKDQFYNYRLADSFRIATNMPYKHRPYTHIHRGKDNTLDYVLVSNSLNPKNAQARAEVTQFQVWNKHLAGDDIHNRVQSDHGQVCIQLIPCEPLSADSPRNNSIKSPQDIKNREDFLHYAGGILQSDKHFRHWGSHDKWQNFWAFFFDTQHGWVNSIYGTIPVDELYQKKHHSIEHIIPRDFLDRYLTHKNAPRYIRYGASINPFNFAPSERGLNTKRSNFPFDLEDDKIIRPYRLELHPENYSGTGFDAEHEWVIPSRTRGDIARALLYMLMTYEIDTLYNQHIDTLVHWAKIDSPTSWEIAYNQWIYSQYGIRNPFIDTPENALHILKNKELLRAIEYRE